MEAAGAKRKRALDAWSVDEVIAWLRGCDVFAGAALDELVAKVTDGEIDGEVLATVTEADLGALDLRAQRAAGPLLCCAAHGAAHGAFLDSPRLRCAARRRGR